jgi:hypothetical protein
MGRSLAFAALTLSLLGCGPGNQRSGVLPQADTPPDPPATAVAESSTINPPPASSATPSG